MTGHLADGARPAALPGLDDPAGLAALLEAPASSQPADDPVWDAERLAQVLAHGLADPERVQRVVGDLLRQVARELGVRVAMLNGVLTDTQVVAGQHGLRGWLEEARATPVEWSLCATVVREGRPWTVPDMARDPRTADNPLHRVDGLQTYAGVPLRAADGSVLGALCVMDSTPRDFGQHELDVLGEAAEHALRMLAAVPVPRDGSGADRSEDVPDLR